MNVIVTFGSEVQIGLWLNTEAGNMDNLGTIEETYKQRDQQGYPFSIVCKFGSGSKNSDPDSGDPFSF